MNQRSLTDLKINAIDCFGLNESDQQRIAEIGYWDWLDETARQSKSEAKRRVRPSRRVKDAIWAGFEPPKEGSNQPNATR